MVSACGAWRRHAAAVAGAASHWGTTLAAEVVGEGVVWLDLLQLVPA